jgi:MraZ protein
MAEFTGRHEHTLDEKGRVSVPAAFRRQITGEDLYLNLGMDGCLELYPPEKWQLLRDGLKKLARGQGRQRFFLRRFASHLRPVTIDAQGRIGIPADLLDLAGIRGIVVFLGQLDTIELWSPDRLEAVMSREDVSYEEVAEGLDIEL